MTATIISFFSNCRSPKVENSLAIKHFTTLVHVTPPVRIDKINSWEKGISSLFKINPEKNTSINDKRKIVKGYDSGVKASVRLVAQQAKKKVNTKDLRKETFAIVCKYLYTNTFAKETSTGNSNNKK